jgi:tetratricopeptide (TPR) repeat protein
VLAALGQADPAFGRELVALVAHAQEAPGVGGLVTQVYGHAQVGKLVTVGHAGDIHVHLPAAPAPTVLDRLPATRPGPVVANLPPPNRTFTGRQDLLERLDAALHPGQAAAVVQGQGQTLHGLGGVGKTQLAVEYAHRHAADYDLIWWVTAEQPAAIPGQLAGLAHRLGLPETIDQAETIQALWDALRLRDRWLLIFDNAEDPADLRPYWPPGTGHVVVTSRNPAWGGIATPVAVDVLPREEAVAFLVERTGGSDQASLEALAEVLGDLPLALEQAAAYLEETGTPPDEYLALLRDRAPELFALGRPTTSDQTIATTWTASLDRIRTTTPAAEDLLRLCAFFGPDDLPRSLLTDHPDVLPEPLAAAVLDQLGFQQLLGALRRYSLVTVTGDAVSMHRLVQAVVRDGLVPNDQRQWATVALDLIRATLPDRPEQVDAWPVYARLLPHALAAAGNAAKVDAAALAPADVLHQIGEYLRSRAEYQQAEQVLRRALAIRETVLGDRHPDTLASLETLARVLQAQADLDGARALHERVLAIREARFGAEHPETAKSLGALAGVFHDQGDLETARALHERALAIREVRLGSDHPDTAESLNYLSNVLYDQGDLTGARELRERALAIREARLGPDHPDTLWTLSNLATVLGDQGHLDSARALHERALAIREARLGPDHPDIAFGLNYLGHILRAQGDLDGARAHFERALRINEARLGPRHPETGRSLTNIGIILLDQGDLDGARAHFQRALSIDEARGRDRSDTATDLHNLALVLETQGDLDGARALQERALAIDEASGPDHPRTARSLNNLATILARQGDLDTARGHLERALAIFEARLGPNHPDSAGSLTNLGKVLFELGELDAARTYLERAVAIREAKLGPDHPDVAESLDDLWTVLYRLGDLATARDVLERALSGKQAGLEDRDTAIRWTNLGLTSHALHDWRRAQAAYEQALKSWEAELGPSHRIVTAILHRLGTALGEAGDPATASALHKRALATREARLGSDHASFSMGLSALGIELVRLGDLAGAQAALERALLLLGIELGVARLKVRRSGVWPGMRDLLGC